MANTKMICIGTIGAPHGIKGHLRIRLFLESPQNIHQYTNLFFEDNTPFVIHKILRFDKGSVIISAKSVPDRTVAETLKNKKLYAPRTALPELEDDTFYHTDLIDLDVRETADGLIVGKVKYVHDHGAGAILEIYDPRTQRSVLVPFRNEAVPFVSLSEGYITVNAVYLQDLQEKDHEN
jgi:16S rRNA processing protein RimM